MHSVRSYEFPFKRVGLIVEVHTISQYLCQVLELIFRQPALILEKNQTNHSSAVVIKLFTFETTGLVISTI